MQNGIYRIVYALIFLSSCGLPKATLQRLNESPQTDISLPLDYCNVFPEPTFEQWDKDYNHYNRFLTPVIHRTQVSMSFEIDGVRTWMCVPSAMTHVQLDTNTMIKDVSQIQGEWRAVCVRTVQYVDSADHITKKFYRSSKELNNPDDDVYLSLHESKFRLYVRQGSRGKYQRKVNKRCFLENKRFLLVGPGKAGAAVNFVGLDKENRLIINSYAVVERVKKGVYATYYATMTQLIFKKF